MYIKVDKIGKLWYNEFCCKYNNMETKVERFKTFTVLISALTRSIRKIKTEEMAKWNLKSHHVSCIYYLYVKKSLTAKELCDICGEDKANISRAIEYLEENGFLYCDSSGQKRYKKRFKLTEKGVEVGKTINSRVETILDQAGAGISDESRKIMYDSLTMIEGNLQKITDEYGK